MPPTPAPTTAEPTPVPTTKRPTGTPQPTPPRTTFAPTCSQPDIPICQPDVICVPDTVVIPCEQEEEINDITCSDCPCTCPSGKGKGKGKGKGGEIGKGKGGEEGKGKGDGYVGKGKGDDHYNHYSGKGKGKGKGSKGAKARLKKKKKKRKKVVSSSPSFSPQGEPSIDENIVAQLDFNGEEIDDVRVQSVETTASWRKRKQKPSGVQIDPNVEVLGAQIEGEEAGSQAVIGQRRRQKSTSSKVFTASNDIEDSILLRYLQLAYDENEMVASMDATNEKH